MNLFFDPSVKAQDPVYTNIRDCKQFLDAKEFIETIWAVYHPYADNHFKQEISKNCLERYWEMYLAWGLLEKGFSLTSANEGPDIGMEVREGTVWFEAIAPKAGHGKNAVPGFSGEKGKVVVRAFPEEKVLLRITGAIGDKFLKYEHYLARNHQKKCTLCYCSQWMSGPGSIS